MPAAGWLPRPTTVRAVDGDPSHARHRRGLATGSAAAGLDAAPLCSPWARSRGRPDAARRRRRSRSRRVFRRRTARSPSRCWTACSSREDSERCSSPVRHPRRRGDAAAAPAQDRSGYHEAGHRRRLRQLHGQAQRPAHRPAAAGSAGEDQPRRQRRGRRRDQRAPPRGRDRPRGLYKKVRDMELSSSRSSTRTTWVHGLRRGLNEITKNAAARSNRRPRFFHCSKQFFQFPDIPASLPQRRRRRPRAPARGALRRAFRM